MFKRSSARAVSRRKVLLSGAAFASTGLLLQACAGGATSPPEPRLTAAPTTAPAKVTVAELTPTPRVQPIPKKAGATDLKIWFHWGGKTGESAQELINKYNSTQGDQDKIYVTIETVRDQEYRQKMTAVRLAGTPPDVYHTSIPIPELVKNEVVAELPKEEQDYVKVSYVQGTVDRMTYQGKVWGYPTEHQAPAFLFRKSYLKEISAEPPKTTDEVRELAKRLAKSEGGKKTRYGFTQWYDNYPATFHLPGLIARFGGTMYHFDGDRPVKIDVTSSEAIEAVGWWRNMVDDGVTQVGEMPFTDAWQNGFAATGEIEVWFTLINVKNAGKQDMYDDLGAVAVPPKAGIKPIVFAGGWELIGDRNSKQPDARWKFMQWMMHKPEMPFSRFIVETIGALPAPKDYPPEIPGWSKDMLEGYAKQTVAIAQAHPSLKVFGSGEINTVIATAIQSIMLKKQTPAEALKEVNPKIDEILKRTDG